MEKAGKENTGQGIPGRQKRGFAPVIKKAQKENTEQGCRTPAEPENAGLTQPDGPEKARPEPTPPLSLLRPGERLDDLERNHLKIIQHPQKFCFGMDAVLLSGFARVRQGEMVVDLGTGTGIIPILLSAKTSGQHFTGLELQPESADMARRSVKYNGLEQRIRIAEGDIREAAALLGASAFDVVTTNPPYMTGCHGLVNPDLPKAIARHEIRCTLEDVVREGAKLLRPNGRFYMVHRPFRLAEIIQTLGKYRLEPKRIKFVHPFADREPSMVLFECVRGGKPRVRVEAPLIIYTEPGKYAPEIKELYGY